MKLDFMGDSIHYILTLSQPFKTNVVHSLIHLCTLAAHIANTMDPDQTALLGAF